MSGFAGIVNLDGKPIDSEMLARMSAAMAFRGPHASGQWVGSNLGLTHTLLRTGADSGDAPQPLLDETGELCLVLDGRIDDRFNLARALETHGARLRSHSNAELVLQAYKVWGEDCPTKLLGDFAFAIWDGPRRQLFCARDPLGAKPFFYAQLKESFIFGNTIQALRHHPGVTDELNESYLGDFLLFSFPQDRTATAFRDLLRLAPAHSLCISSRLLRLKQYWQLPNVGELRYKNPGDYVEHFRELLSAAVTDRLRTEKVTVLMSGGLDSPSIAAVAQQVMASEGRADGLRALCIHHSGAFADPEKGFAEIAARHLNIPLEFLDASSVRLYSPWQGRELEAPEPADLPLAELCLREVHAVSSWAPVVLTGYDGDTLLEANLHRHWRNQLSPRGLLRTARDFMQYAVLERAIPRVGFRTFLKRRAMDPFQLYPPWLDPDFERRCDLRERWLSAERVPKDSVHPGIWRMTEDPIWPALLEGYDPGRTGAPVVYRHPLTDLRLLLFCLALPPVPWCLRKRLIRVAMRGVLPKAILRRPKTTLAGDPTGAALRRGGLAQLPSLRPAAPYVRAEFAPPQAELFGDVDRCRVYLRPYSLAVWLGSTMGATACAK